MVGGSGALGKPRPNAGSSVLKRFRSAFKCVNIAPHESTLAHHNVLIKGDQILGKKAVEEVRQSVEKHANRYDAIICTAGGFNGSFLAQ